MNYKSLIFQLNEYEDEETFNDDLSPHVPDQNDFNALRQERLAKRKEDLLKLLDILKDDKVKAKKILDEIIK